MICAAVASVDPALSLRYAQSLLSQRVALNVTHGKRVFTVSPCDSVSPGLHDFMHRNLAAVAEGAASNFSTDLPGSPCPKCAF